MSEPKLTLHSQRWREARDRVHAVDAETRPIFLALLDHVGRGWQAFRPLQEWLEQNRGNARTDPDDYTHLLNFVEGELSDTFMLIGTGVADIVPGWPGWEAEADPAEVEGWTETFGRNLAVFRLACACADVPEPFHHLALSVAGVMESGRWCEEMCALLGTAGELIPPATD